MTGPEDDRLVQAFVERAQLDLARIGEQQLDDGWARMQGLAAPSSKTRKRPTWAARVALAAVLTTSAAIIVAYGLTYRSLPPDDAPPLQYSLTSIAGAAGGVTDGLPGSRLAFSDGSRIDFSALTKVTVDALSADGAQVTLIDGDLDVLVKPRDHSAWTFAAGPFAIKVKGTSFELSYSSVHQRMSLRMTTGLVEVLGTQGRAITVSGGESIELFAEPALRGTTLDSANAEEQSARGSSLRTLGR